METVKQQTVKIQITLTWEEADMLKDLIQNPIKENEPQEEYEFREELFSKLLEILR